MFRIPFTLAGTVYSQYLAVDLARFALKVKIRRSVLFERLSQPLHIVLIRDYLRKPLWILGLLIIYLWEQLFKNQGHQILQEANNNPLIILPDFIKYKFLS